MEISEKEILEQLKAEKEKRFNDKLTQFKDLAKELDLSEEEAETYPHKTVEDLEASITGLKILKGRINQMKDLTGNPDYKGDPKKPFFGLRQGTKKPSEPKPKEIKFNSFQLFDKMRAASTENELFDSDCMVIRLYTNPFDEIGRKI